MRTSFARDIGIVIFDKFVTTQSFPCAYALKFSEVNIASIEITFSWYTTCLAIVATSYLSRTSSPPSVFFAKVQSIHLVAVLNIRKQLLV